jgi:hypothetical protein
MEIDNIPEPELFQVRFELSIRDFKGHTSGATGRSFVISCNSIEQFKEKLEQHVQPMDGQEGSDYR